MKRYGPERVGNCVDMVLEEACLDTTDPENPIVSLDLWYPRSQGEVKTIEIGLMDVRAADGIRVSYDFDRDGWVVMQQAPTIEGESTERNGIAYVDMTPGEWREVFFAPAFALGGPEPVKAGSDVQEPVALR